MINILGLIQAIALGASMVEVEEYQVVDLGVNLPFFQELWKILKSELTLKML